MISVDHILFVVVERMRTVKAEAGLQHALGTKLK